MGIISCFCMGVNFFDLIARKISKDIQTTTNLIIVRLMNDSSFSRMFMNGNAHAQKIIGNITINQNFS